MDPIRTRSLVLLLAAMLAGCSTGRIPPKSQPVVDHAVIPRDVHETADMVERFLAARGGTVERHDGLLLHGNPASRIDATNGVNVTLATIPLPDTPPTDLPAKLGCDCGTPEENILIDKSGYFDDFVITRHVSIEEIDSATSLVVTDFRYDASYHRPGGLLDARVHCQSTGSVEAALLAWLLLPNEERR